MRAGLVRFEVGVELQEDGSGAFYCSTLLTEEASMLKELDPEFLKMLDDSVAAVAKAISEYGGTDGASARSFGPGAERLAAALKEHGVSVKVVDAPVEVPDGAPVH